MPSDVTEMLTTCGAEAFARCKELVSADSPPTLGGVGVAVVREETVMRSRVKTTMHTQSKHNMTINLRSRIAWISMVAAIDH